MFKGAVKWLSGRGDSSSQLSQGKAPSLGAYLLDDQSEVR